GRVAPAEALGEALNIAKYYKRAKAITTELPAELPPIVGVRDELVQVFLNLILNAIDATAQGGVITVSAAATEAAVIIQVCDTGAGVAAEDRERVFQPYFTTKKHGTGLGLFVTKKLVQDHGGSIEFTSKPGDGTTFTIRLPVMEMPPFAFG